MKYFFTACILLLSLGSYSQDFNTIPRLNNTSGGLVIADFNNDSFPDIIFPQRITFQGVKRVVVELNAASDTLAFAEQEFTLPTEVFGTPAAADFDDDGDLDLVFSTLAEANLLLLLQEEGGGLMDTILSIPGSVALQAAELNGDDFPDIVALNINDREIVAYRNVNGTEFTKQTLYGQGSSIAEFKVADLDGDGDLDVVVGTDTFTGEALVALMNDGTGTFTKAVIEATSGTVRSIDDIAVGDLNGDDRTDIVVVASNNFCFAYYLQEEGTYVREQVAVTGNIFRSVAIGDFNGDRANDLVVGDNSGDGIRLLTNDGAATPTFSSSDVLGIVPVFSMAPRDMNRDGDLDLVASNGEIYVLENTITQVPPVSVSSVQLREMTVFPNPAGAEQAVFIQGGAEWLGGSYQLLDLRGRIVRTGKVEAGGRIDVQGIVRGSYLLQVLQDNFTGGRTLLLKQ